MESKDCRPKGPHRTLAVKGTLQVTSADLPFWPWPDRGPNELFSSRLFGCSVIHPLSSYLLSLTSTYTCVYVCVPVCVAVLPVSLRVGVCVPEQSSAASLISDLDYKHCIISKITSPSTSDPAMGWPLVSHPTLALPGWPCPREQLSLSSTAQVLPHPTCDGY